MENDVRDNDDVTLINGIVLKDDVTLVKGSGDNAGEEGEGEDYEEDETEEEEEYGDVGESSPGMTSVDETDETNEENTPRAASLKPSKTAHTPLKLDLLPSTPLAPNSVHKHKTPVRHATKQTGPVLDDNYDLLYLENGVDNTSDGDITNIQPGEVTSAASESDSTDLSSDGSDGGEGEDSGSEDKEEEGEISTHKKRQRRAKMVHMKSNDASTSSEEEEEQDDINSDSCSSVSPPLLQTERDIILKRKGKGVDRRVYGEELKLIDKRRDEILMKEECAGEELKLIDSAQYGFTQPMWGCDELMSRGYKSTTIIMGVTSPWMREEGLSKIAEMTLEEEESYFEDQEHKEKMETNEENSICSDVNNSAVVKSGVIKHNPNLTDNNISDVFHADNSSYKEDISEDNDFDEGKEKNGIPLDVNIIQGKLFDSKKMRTDFGWIGKTDRSKVLVNISEQVEEGVLNTETVMGSDPTTFNNNDINELLLAAQVTNTAADVIIVRANDVMEEEHEEKLFNDLYHAKYDDINDYDTLARSDLSSEEEEEEEQEEKEGKKEQGVKEEKRVEEEKGQGVKEEKGQVEGVKGVKSEDTRMITAKKSLVNISAMIKTKPSSLVDTKQVKEGKKPITAENAVLVQRQGKFTLVPESSLKPSERYLVKPLTEASLYSKFDLPASSPVKGEGVVKPSRKPKVNAQYIARLARPVRREELLKTESDTREERSRLLPMKSGFVRPLWPVPKVGRIDKHDTEVAGSKKDDQKKVKVNDGLTHTEGHKSLTPADSFSENRKSSELESGAIRKTIGATLNKPPAPMRGSVSAERSSKGSYMPPHGLKIDQGEPTFSKGSYAPPRGLSSSLHKMELADNRLYKDVSNEAQNTGVVGQWEEGRKHLKKRMSFSSWAKNKNKPTNEKSPLAVNKPTNEKSAMAVNHSEVGGDGEEGADKKNAMERKVQFEKWFKNKAALENKSHKQKKQKKNGAQSRGKHSIAAGTCDSGSTLQSTGGPGPGIIGSSPSAWSFTSE